VATLEPLTVAELDAAISAWLSTLAADGVPRRKAQLRELHDLLLGATAVSRIPPGEPITVAVKVATAVDAALIEAMAPRPRTVMRLFRAGAAAAAWEVLIDNASGTPVRAQVKASRAFALLPGFRDPRLAAPDHCYDVTDAAVLRHEVDDIQVEAGVVNIGGWAAFDLLATSAAEPVRLLVGDVAVVGARRRRADLVSGRGEGLVRRAWAGWSATIDLAAVKVGEWELSLEVDHDGLTRRVSLGTEVSDFARAASRGVTEYGDRSISWLRDDAGWRLKVQGRRPTQWGGVLRRTSL
jgi:hypothetical protein